LTAEGIAALIEDIRKNGLLQPPVVTPDLRVVMGERRVLALRALGIEEVEVIVVFGLDSLETIEAFMLGEGCSVREKTLEERVGFFRYLLSTFVPVNKSDWIPFIDPGIEKTISLKEEGRFDVLNWNSLTPLSKSVWKVSPGGNSSQPP